MKTYVNQIFEEERALYGSDGIELTNCRFDGPADGESALKECKNITASNCYFNLRYPFWHDEHVKMSGSEMTELCRAAYWYSKDIHITGSKLHGIKALRECENIKIEDSDIVSTEFGWSVDDICMKNTHAVSEYFMLRSRHMNFDGVSLEGKYSFQYIEDSTFVNCNFDTKDAFWHAKNIVIRDSIVKGEYLAWYCENVTFENCMITGTQPFCYCKGLKLVNCRMEQTDLAFEKSEVDAEITTVVDSVKNPMSGEIRALGVKELIMDDPAAHGKVIVTG